jgi:carbonic anhydrase
MQLENLRTHPAVAVALARGAVRLHGWVYKFETGQVFGYEVATGEFLPLVNPSASPDEVQAGELPDCIVSSTAGQDVVAGR